MPQSVIYRNRKKKKKRKIKYQGLTEKMPKTGIIMSQKEVQYSTVQLSSVEVCVKTASELRLLLYWTTISTGLRLLKLLAS